MYLSSGEKYLLYPDKLWEIGFNWDVVFGRDAPFELEIGPGYDPFILKRAKKFKEKNFLAIEIDPERVKHLIDMTVREGIKNLRFFCGDAKFLLPNAFSKDFFDKIFILFPDPWPKKRHSKNRLLTLEFLLLLFFILKPGSSLLVATDDKSYSGDIGAYLKEMENINCEVDTCDLKDMDHITKFEKLFLNKERDIFYFRCYKDVNFNDRYFSEISQIIDRERVEFIEEFSTFTFNSNLSPAEVYGRFSKRYVRSGSSIFKYEDLYISEDGRSLILEGICKSKRLLQKLFFKIVMKESGSFEVRLFTNRKIIFVKEVREFLLTFLSIFFT